MIYHIRKKEVEFVFKTCSQLQKQRLKYIKNGQWQNYFLNLSTLGGKAKHLTTFSGVGLAPSQPRAGGVDEPFSSVYFSSLVIKIQKWDY